MLWQHEQFKSEFSIIVLNHMTNILLLDEWESLRNLSSSHPVVSSSIRVDATREEVLEDSLCESHFDPKDIFASNYNHLTVAIGLIDGEPVYYVKNEGYYFWGRDGACLDAMITWPAYPPNWIWSV